jgi:hypothetical protein
MGAQIAEAEELMEEATEEVRERSPLMVGVVTMETLLGAPGESTSAWASRSIWSHSWRASRTH